MDDNNTLHSRNRSKHWKAAGVILLVVVVSVIAARQDAAQLIAFIGRNRPLGLFISVFVYALLGATPVPSEPLTVFLALLYGPLPAVIVTTIGNTLAALIEFFIGGSIGDLADFERRRARLPFRLGELPVHSPIFLLLGRMLPGFGPKFVSLAAGMYRVPLFTYLWTVFIATLAGALAAAYGGYRLVLWWRHLLTVIG